MSSGLLFASFFLREPGVLITFTVATPVLTVGPYREPVTGVNDGLAHFSRGALPDPTCSADASPADAPAGMADAKHLASTKATDAVTCRTAWPHGRARSTRSVLRTPSVAPHLATLLNQAEHQRAPAGARQCIHRSAEACDAVDFTGPNMRIDGSVDEINCGRITNCSRNASTTSTIDRALARAFAP